MKSVSQYAAAFSLADRNSSQFPKEDDWSGIIDPRTRRRLQNRLNQRACRKRKQTQTSQVSTSELVSLSSDQIQKGYPRRWLSLDDTQSLVEKIKDFSFETYARGSSTDGHLIILSKLYVYRAFLRNLAILGVEPHRDWTSQDTISRFNTCTPEHINEKELPVSLRPTEIQLKIPYHPWLDFFPFPKMRDNLISAGDKLDDAQFCVEVMGFWDISTNSCSILVWGEPSDPNSWEITEAFLKRWPWVYSGLHQAEAETVMVLSADVR
ncbi:hypothetical protein PENSTE_c006G00110 [Penicillium steckii]|uniref:BZIP domain-containing protein n=1 Tax=Penicillium steckii TaxID=303698 RepID=A0A1V6TGP2_9EURO|nr:hypothetical protein PENSTE_c006G00110 [Penicillium steckii]